MSIPNLGYHRHLPPVKYLLYGDTELNQLGGHTCQHRWAKSFASYGKKRD